MDALVNGLMEELNCETVFTIPLFGGIPIYESVVVTWIIMAALAIVFFLLGRNLKKKEPKKEPNQRRKWEAVKQREKR